jgi:DNA-directed RNA polymerase specialized sigma24 family protein
MLAGTVQRYASRLFVFLYRLTGDIHTAESLVDDVLMEFFRHPGHRARANPLVALYGIAAQFAARRLSNQKVLPFRRSLPDSAVAGPLTEDSACRQQLASVLDRLFALPFPQRAAVLMHKYDCLDYVSIARALQLDEVAAASLVRDGYRQLCGAAKPS